MAPNLTSHEASEVNLIRVFIQVEAGSRERNLYDEKTLEYKGTRRALLPYPYPYGFVIGTSAADDDSIDCYVITEDSLQNGIIVECEPIGLLEMEEDGEEDHKILAAIPGQEVNLNEQLLEEFRDFIYGVFAKYPEITVRVGQILQKEVAQRYVSERRDV